MGDGSFRVVSALLAGLLMCCAGCSSSGSGGAGNQAPDASAAKDAADIAAADTETPLEPDYKIEPFSIVVEGQQALAVDGVPLEFMARVVAGAPEGEVTWSWKLPEGAVLGKDSVLTAKDIILSFSKPGQYLVECEAVDAAQNRTVSGALVSIFPSTYAEGDFLVGDVDGDGIVDGEDVALVEKHVAQNPRLDPASFDRADVNRDGLVDDADLMLVKNARDNGGAAPIFLSSDSAAGGRAMHLLHPALLNPGAQFKLRITADGLGEKLDQNCLARFGDAATDSPFSMFRGAPGHASFVTPEWMYCLTAEVNGTLLLEKTATESSVVVYQAALRLLPLPAASAQPGALVLKTMQGLEDAYLAMEGVLKSYAGAVGADAEQYAALVGTFRAARQEFRQQNANFQAVFGLLDTETKALYERLAIANGLAEAAAGLDIQIERLGGYQDGTIEAGLTFGQSDAIIGAICAFRNVAAISEKVAGINEVVSAVTSVGVFLQAVPLVGQAIAVLRTISNVVSMVTDIIGMLAEYIPQFGDTIEVSASPSALTVGQSADVTAGLAIKLLSGLCEKGAEGLVGSIMDALKGRLTNKLIGKIPLLSSAYNAANQDKEKMSWVGKKVVEGVEYVAGKLLELGGIEDLLKSLGQKICGLFEGADPRLPLDPSFLKVGCGAVASGKWPCTQACIGSWTISGARDICGAEKKGECGVSCRAPDQTGEDTVSDPDTTGADTSPGETVFTEVETPGGYDFGTEYVPGEPPEAGPEGPQTPVVFGWSMHTRLISEAEELLLGKAFTVWIDFTLAEGEVSTAFMAMQEGGGYLKVSKPTIDTWYGQTEQKSAVFDLIVPSDKTGLVGTWPVRFSVAPKAGAGEFDAAHVGNWIGAVMIFAEAE